ncbi:TPA: hypothetical protein NR353_003156 [Legionella pneumophila]|nr:hypothetical protein [Legionella pneumophila]HCJ4380967.1 hypothetical protein [Legionella pneumophila]
MQVLSTLFYQDIKAHVAKQRISAHFTCQRALHLPARLLWSLRSNVDFLFLYSLEIPCKSRKILRMD